MHRLDVLVRLHCLQGLDELRLLRERGTTPLDLLERVGLLTDHRLLIPHGIYTDVGTIGGGAMHRIADAGATVIHCPLTSAHYATALNTFDSYRDAGVRLALGTDSFPPDMLRGIDVGSSVAKILEARLDAGEHASYVEAATLGGAHALRRPDLGRIAAGATADVIAVRLDDVRDGVVDDPIRTAVQHTTARAVDFSMVGGRTRVRDGVMVDADMRALAREAQELFAKLRTATATAPRRPRPPRSCSPRASPRGRPCSRGEPGRSRVGTDGTPWIPDAEQLTQWVIECRSLLAEHDRAKVGDEMLGAVLAYGASEAAEGWPAAAVCEVLEIVGTHEMENGFVGGVMDARGSWTKGIYEGGDQERELAHRFRARADEREDWRRVHRALKAVARGYERQAQRADAEAKRDADGA